MATLNIKFTNQLITEAGTKIKIFETINPRVQFVQNETCTKAGIGIHKYGVAMIPDPLMEEVAYILETTLDGVTYYADAETIDAAEVGEIIEMTDTPPAQGGGEI